MRVFAHEPPSELDEENRRTEEARAAAVPPVVEIRPKDPNTPVVPLAIEAEELRRLQGDKADLVTIGDRSWAPSSPVEVVAALQMLAEEACVHALDIGELAEFTGIEGEPGMTLAARLEVLERLIYGDTKAKDGLPTSGVGFKLKGHDDRLEAIEGRLARVEARLNDDPNWKPDPDDPAQGFLWLSGRCDGGPHVGQRVDRSSSPVLGLPLADMASRTLQPRTWAQLLDCLGYLASEVAVLVSDKDGVDVLGASPVGDEDKERLAEVLAAAHSKRAQNPKPARSARIKAELAALSEECQRTAELVGKLSKRFA
jgi:hypothetical protein